MHLSPITGPHGRPIFSSGGEHAWKTFVHRGFVVSLEWVASKTRRRAAPCMVIWAATNVLTVQDAESGMWAIGRRAISEFVEFTRDGKCTGSASDHCIREAQAALPILGKDANDKNAINALVDCVIKYAPDLVSMPPTPAALQKAAAVAPMWEVQAKDKSSGKIISEVEV